MTITLKVALTVQAFLALSLFHLWVKSILRGWTFTKREGFLMDGVLVYFVLRPPRTLEDEYQRTLEEEALLAAIEDQLLCPGCERRVKDNWMLCPNCQTKLKKNCHECNELMELPWNICPHCGTPELGMRKEGMSMDDVLRNLNVEEEPEESKDEETSDQLDEAP